MIEKNHIALVIQGGSMRSIFTVGILDAFSSKGFNPFSYCVGVSGGAMSLSYYLSEQYGTQYRLMQELVKDKKFINLKNIFSTEGLINLEYLEKFATKNYPIDFRKIIQNLRERMVEIVATNMKNGTPVYLNPTPQNWFQHLRASASLPFLSRGVFHINDMKLMDGGWSDAIPVKRAIKQGAKKIVVIRTLPSAHREDWTCLGVFGGFWHRNNPKLKIRFTKDHIFYNESADFLEMTHSGYDILQIAPEKYLSTSSYFPNVDSMRKDYLYGLHLGLKFLKHHGDQFYK